jgi:hypothetical protein
MRLQVGALQARRALEQRQSAEEEGKMTDWSWRTGHGTHFNDVFDTREGAIADARVQLGPGGIVYVGRVVDVVPEDYVSADIDWILETMDEAAEIDSDDRIFDADDGGREALNQALKAWAREHVYTLVPLVMRDEEPVNLLPDEEEKR